MMRAFVMAMIVTVALGFAPKMQRSSMSSLAAKSKSVPFLEQPAALMEAWQATWGSTLLDLLGSGLT